MHAAKSLPVSAPAPAAKRATSYLHHTQPTSSAKTLPNAEFKASDMEILPNELVSSILGFLDSPPPSISALYDEPLFELTHRKESDTPLKVASLLNRKWRQAALPHLFKHAQFTVKEERPHRAVINDQIQLFYDFVKANSLHGFVQSFTLLVQAEKIAYLSQDDHGPESFLAFWPSLFAVIDPADLLLVAHGEALGDLTSCSVYLQDAWAFDCPCQYLHLSRTTRSGTESSKEADTQVRGVSPVSSKTAKSPGGTSFNGSITGAQLHSTYSQLLAGTPSNSLLPVMAESSSTMAKDSAHPISESSNVFYIRPWASLLLNEGSFIRAYASYEFWLRQPPSILPDLVGDRSPPVKPLISPLIKELSYIGIFPMAHHFGTLTTHCPPVERLYVQIVPRNEILQIPSKMAQVEAEDLWMERNSCYALLMREMFTTPPSENFKHLKFFESGDAADKDAWNLAVDYIVKSGGRWKVVADGVLEKDLKDLKEDEDGEPLSFDGNLVRWAWNGTTNLPVSSYPLYTGAGGP